MNSHLLSAVRCSLVVGLVLAGTAASAHAQSADSVRIVGVVTQKGTGEPIKAAAVGLRNGRGITNSDTSGVFSLTVPIGKSELVTRARGFTPLLREIEISSANARDTVRVELAIPEPKKP